MKLSFSDCLNRLRPRKRAFSMANPRSSTVMERVVSNQNGRFSHAVTNAWFRSSQYLKNRLSEEVITSYQTVNYLGPSWIYDSTLTPILIMCICNTKSQTSKTRWKPTGQISKLSPDLRVTKTHRTMFDRQDWVNGEWREASRQRPDSQWQTQQGSWSCCLGWQRQLRCP